MSRIVKPPGIDSLTPQQARIVLADRVEAWIRGEITNLELDDFVMWLPLGAKVKGVSVAVWSTYDDFKRHRPRRLSLAILKRCCAFLRTDLSEAPPTRVPAFFGLLYRSQYPSFWPFASQKEWITSRSMSTIEVPDYRPDEVRQIRRHFSRH